MEQPTLPVETKYGTLTLTFVDSVQPTKKPHSGWNAPDPRTLHVARLDGEIASRGVHVRLSAYLYYAKRFYRKGVELEKHVIELDADYNSTYNRRFSPETGCTLNGDIPAGMRKLIEELYNGPVREAYEAHPELQHEAKRFRLWDEAQRALGVVTECKQKLDVAAQDYASKLKALAKFDA